MSLPLACVCSELLTYPTGRHKETKYQCLAVSELDNLIPPGNYCRFRYRAVTVRIIARSQRTLICNQADLGKIVLEGEVQP